MTNQNYIEELNENDTDNYVEELLLKQQYFDFIDEQMDAFYSIKAENITE